MVSAYEILETDCCMTGRRAVLLQRRHVTPVRCPFCGRRVAGKRLGHAQGCGEQSALRNYRRGNS